jgi:hypothetical protein
MAGVSQIVGFLNQRVLVWVAINREGNFAEGIAALYGVGGYAAAGLTVVG